MQPYCRKAPSPSNHRNLGSRESGLTASHSTKTPRECGKSQLKHHTTPPRILKAHNQTLQNHITNPVRGRRSTRSEPGRRSRIRPSGSKRPQREDIRPKPPPPFFLVSFSASPYIHRTLPQTKALKVVVIPTALHSIENPAHFKSSWSGGATTPERNIAKGAIVTYITTPRANAMALLLFRPNKLVRSLARYCWWES